MFLLISDIEDDITEVKKENINYIKEKTIEEDVRTRDSPASSLERNDKVPSETMVALSPEQPSSPDTIQRKGPHISLNSVEDSPVKSLRKWVDGCFVQGSVPSCPSAVQSVSVGYQTPPSTPPQRTSTETPVIATGNIPSELLLLELVNLIFLTDIWSSFLSCLSVHPCVSLSSACTQMNIYCMFVTQSGKTLL